jgi:hypothetical protein
MRRRDQRPRVAVVETLEGVRVLPGDQAQELFVALFDHDHAARMIPSLDRQDKGWEGNAGHKDAYA